MKLFGKKLCLEKYKQYEGNQEYRYDQENRLTEVWEKGNRLAAYAYYPDDAIKSLHCGNLYTEYAYDADRNLASLKTPWEQKCWQTTTTATTETETG